MADIESLQNNYAQLFSQIVARLADIVKKLGEEWKEAQQQYDYEIKLLKSFENAKKVTKSLLSLEDVERVTAAGKGLPDDLKANAQNFLNDYTPLRTTLEGTMQQFEKTIAQETEANKEKTEKLKTEIARLKDWFNALSRDMPSNPAEVRQWLFRPVGAEAAHAGAAIKIVAKKIKYKPIDVDVLIAIVNEIITLLQNKFFEPSDIATRRLSSGYLVEQIDSLMKQLIARINKFRNEYDSLAKAERATIAATGLKFKVPPKRPVWPYGETKGLET